MKAQMLLMFKKIQSIKVQLSRQLLILPTIFNTNFWSIGILWRVIKVFNMPSKKISTKIKGPSFGHQNSYVNDIILHIQMVMPHKMLILKKKE